MDSNYANVWRVRAQTGPTPYPQPVAVLYNSHI